MVASVSNTAGTIAGLATLLTSSSVVNAVAAMSPFVYLGATTGFPPLIFASAALGVASLLVNYGVTHWAEGRVINDNFETWWPMLKAVMSVKTYQQYPNETGIK